MNGSGTATLRLLHRTGELSRLFPGNCNDMVSGHQEPAGNSQPQPPARAGDNDVMHDAAPSCRWQRQPGKERSLWPPEPYDGQVRFGRAGESHAEVDS